LPIGKKSAKNLGSRLPFKAIFKIKTALILPIGKIKAVFVSFDHAFS
jgi:hypothetical protein